MSPLANHFQLFFGTKKSWESSFPAFGEIRCAVGDERNLVSTNKTERLAAGFLCGRGRGFYFYCFPRPLGTLYLRLVTIFDAIVLIGVAYGAERFVIEAGESERFFHFFGELL